MNKINYKTKTFLTSGAFSDVYLLNTEDDNKYVMKKTKKYGDYVNIKKTLLEIDILKACNNNYIPKIHYAYESKSHIYIIMDYYQYDLYDLLCNQENNLFFEKQVKYISSCILHGITYLHSQGIIHRDIKLENILLDDMGNIKIIDYNLSSYEPSKIEEKTFISPYSNIKIQIKLPTSIFNNLIGTVEYLAPEIIKGKYYTFMIDWWAFGIMLHELFYGITPFHGETPHDVIDNIKNFKIYTSPEISLSDISSSGKNLIQNLLKKYPNIRLGYNGGGDEIRDHPFYLNINDFKY